MAKITPNQTAILRQMVEQKLSAVYVPYLGYRFLNSDGERVHINERGVCRSLEAMLYTGILKREGGWLRVVAAGRDPLMQLVRGEITLDDYNAGQTRKVVAQYGE